MTVTVTRSYTRPMPSASDCARWAALFCFSALAATTGDRGHVAWRVLEYPGGGQPLWVWLLMGSSGVALVSNYLLWPVGAKEAPEPWRATLAPGAWFLGTYFATAPLATSPVILTAGLLATFVFRMRNERGARAWSYVAMVAVMGPLVEIAISGAGLFRYLHPELRLIPIWLPALYLHVGLVTRAVGRAFVLP